MNLIKIGGAITPTKLNVHALQYLSVYVKCFNDLSQFYEIDKGSLFIEYDRSQDLLNRYCDFQELRFYRANQTKLGIVPRMIELEAILSDSDIMEDILSQAKADALNVNISDILQIVEDVDKQTFYVPFDAFLNAIRMAKLYVEAALNYEHYAEFLLGGDNCVRSLKAYYSLLKELGITVKKQLIISKPYKTQK